MWAGKIDKICRRIAVGSVLANSTRASLPTIGGLSVIAYGTKKIVGSMTIKRTLITQVPKAMGLLHGGSFGEGSIAAGKVSGYSSVE